MQFIRDFLRKKTRKNVNKIFKYFADWVICIYEAVICLFRARDREEQCKVTRDNKVKEVSDEFIKKST